MAKLTIDFPEQDSPRGVSLATIERYAQERSCSPEDLINLVMADFLGIKPEYPDLDAYERVLRNAGIDPVDNKPTLTALKAFFERDNNKP